MVGKLSVSVIALGLWVALVGGCSPPPEEENDPCEDVTCSGHGLCEDRDGSAVCICDEGYHAEELECVEDPEGCTTGSCSGHGTCDDSSGEIRCTCDEGYEGERCDRCAEGYHMEGGVSGGMGECVADVDPCDPDPCDETDCGHGSCSCVDGEAICTCETGWAGESCDECADDYHLLDDACVPCNQLEFQFEALGATTVWLTGDWTGWATTPEAGAIEMEPQGGGLWRVVTTIETGGEHQYKYIVDGSDWRYDPTQPTVDDGFGGYNNLIDVCVFGGGAGSCGDVDTPDWRDLVMYFVMVDRFRDSDGVVDPVPGASDGPPDGPSGQYEGGDLEGVIEELPYLDELGVTAIWLSAPYDNRDSAGAAINPAADSHMYSGYHGYWPSPPNIDYSDPEDPSPRPVVEPRIGDEETLRELVESAHGTPGATGTGIRVMFDYVMNHVDIDSGLYGAHPDWFARDGDHFRLCGPENLWDDPYWGTRCAFTDYLPPFDYENPAARAWSIADALWWAQTFGIDGYRLDAIKHVPMVWLEDLRSALNESILHPWGGRFYLVGETFAYDDAGLIRSFVDPETRLDGQFDFPFKARLCEAVFTEGGSLESFSAWMDGNDRFYGPDAIMTTWIGNHDIPRAIHFASRQIGNCREGSSPSNGWDGASFQQPTDAAPYERLGVAFAIMMTNRGIPLIYYGDEIGLAGGGDPDNRRMMVWDDDALNEHQRALRDKVSALAHIRAENPALTRGTRHTLSVDRDTWVYTMGGCGDTPDVTVAINRADASRTVSIPSGSYEDLLDGGTSSGGSVELAPRSFIVLRHSD